MIWRALLVALALQSVPGIIGGNETVAAISIAGTAVVLLGAYLTSRQEHRLK